jgi:hypothetical protein
LDILQTIGDNDIGHAHVHQSADAGIYISHIKQDRKDSYIQHYLYGLKVNEKSSNSSYMQGTSE